MTDATLSDIVHTILYGIVGLSFVGMMVSAIFFFALPLWLQCPRCKVHVASIKVSDVGTLSVENYQRAGRDREYGGGHVCSECWPDLKGHGFWTMGNWAPGAIVEYLKDTPNFIAIFISVGALVVSVVALLR